MYRFFGWKKWADREIKRKDALNRRKQMKENLQKAQKTVDIHV